jgi:hypothetical protein
MAKNRIWPLLAAIALGVLSLGWVYLHGVMMLNVAR